MVWVVLIAVAVAVVAVVAALVSGRLPFDPLSEPVHTTPATGLPQDPTAADVDTVRFDTAARGYRMSEVDEVLDDLQTRLAAQEEEIARLRDAAEQSPSRAEAPETAEGPRRPSEPGGTRAPARASPD